MGSRSAPGSAIPLTFTLAEFEKVVSWLMLNREDLDVLVHLPTDNFYTTTPATPLTLRAGGLKLNMMHPTYHAEDHLRPRWCRIRSLRA